jgi:hypothetical protein
VEDRIHPNHEGYLIRVRIMRPLLGPPDRKGSHKWQASSLKFARFRNSQSSEFGVLSSKF